MTKQVLKGEAAIAKEKAKSSMRKMELFIFFNERGKMKRRMREVT